MRCRVYDEDTNELIRIEEARPKCGEDLCDQCGDCLACYREGCYQGGKWVRGVPCQWVKYESRRPPAAPPDTKRGEGGGGS